MTFLSSPDEQVQMKKAVEVACTIEHCWPSSRRKVQITKAQKDPNLILREPTQAGGLPEAAAEVMWTAAPDQHAATLMSCQGGSVGNAFDSPSSCHNHCAELLKEPAGLQLHWKLLAVEVAIQSRWFK